MFCLKFSIFFRFLFCENRLFQKEKSLLYTIKQQIKKVEELGFFQRGQSLVLVKNWQFFLFFFQAEQARIMCLAIFQKEKKDFSTLKTISQRSRKNWIFTKGLVYACGKKLLICFIILFSSKQSKKMCRTMLLKGILQS